MNKNVKIGVLLLTVGLLLLLSTAGVLAGEMFLLVLGAGFVGVYVLLGGRKEYGNVGFLIPGVILLAISAFSFYQGTSGSLFFLALSGAFWLVFGLHTFHFRNLQHGERFWPVYPASGLLLFFFLLYGAEVLQWQWSLRSLEMWNYIWVAALIGVGIWIILKKPITGKK